MKSTGIVRQIDQLGRIVIPKELRDIFGIAVKDPLGIFVDGDRIILQQYEPTCVFCSSGDDMTEYKGKKVCVECLAEMADSVKEENAV